MLRATARRLGVILGVILLCPGCGAEPWAGEVSERDGVLYVTNPADGIWQARGEAPIWFELEQTFGVERAPEDAILSPIDAVEVDDRGNVYVLSSAPSRLVAFDSNGNVRWSSDQRGQGPGDLSKPYGLAWDGATSLYLTNQSGARLDSWSVDGKFLESRSMSNNFRYLLRTVGFLSDGRLVLEGSGGATADAFVVVVDLGDSSHSGFAVDVTNQRREDGGVLATVAVEDDMIVVGDYDSYEVRWFAADGSLSRVWARDFNKLKGVAILEELGASTVFSWLYPPLRLTTGDFLVCLSWVETDDVDETFARLVDTGERPVRRNALDLFDARGRLLFSLEGDGGEPEIGRPAKVDALGHLYTITDEPFPRVRRYSVHIG